VVDDNPENLKLVSDLLEWSGYRISKAMDAEQALEVIRQAPPNLILMDIALPGMDGLMLTYFIGTNFIPDIKDQLRRPLRAKGTALKPRPPTMA
jgi:CheY-like chemotaxis protein